VSTKAVLLQLPVQGHDFFFSRENIPLAAACLAAVGRSLGAEVEILPQALMSYGSDQTILRALVEARPAVVGFSCYLWNTERSLFLGRRLKETLPGCLIVVGGPEVTPENDFLLRQGGFDVGVVGEGEKAWESILQAFPGQSEGPGLLLPGGRGRYRFTGVAPLSPAEPGPSPHLSGALDGHMGEVLWIETARGCFNRCAYCYYHKQAPRVRPFRVERVLKEVARAAERGVREIVFLDPCFTRRPGLNFLLDGLIDVNAGRAVRFQGECLLEDIDAGMADRLARAGFVRLEVGLQSIHRATLNGVGRRFRPARFLQGARHLREKGIEAMVDLIAGLPGDTLPGIRESLDWVIDRGAYDFLMLYPLSLLPATELRRRAPQSGLRSLERPPYLVTRTPSLTATEIAWAFRYYEDRMGEEIAPIELPAGLSRGRSGKDPGAGRLRTSLRGRGPAPLRLLADSGLVTAYGLTVSLSWRALKEPEGWERTLAGYLDRNPFTLLAVEVPRDAFAEDLRPIWDLAARRDHFLDRDYTVPHSPWRSVLVLSRFRGWLWKWPDPREAFPVSLPDGQRVPCRPVCAAAGPGAHVPGWLKDHVGKRYSSPPDFRIWEPAVQ
jgi:radical SAM superfamily enzyme YgiQ (UPF0313 family)